MIEYTVKVSDIGNEFWYLDGKLHNENGPAVKYANGDEECWVNGELHNENGPAVKYANGREEYWVNGERHNENGPAVKYANGGEEYYINGEPLTKEEFECRTKTQELTVADIEKLLGHKVKIVK